MVKDEVDRVIREGKKRRKAKRKAKLENVWKSTIGESLAKTDRLRSKSIPPVGNRNFRAPTNGPRPDDNRARTMMNNSNNINHHQHILDPGHIQLRQQQQQQQQQKQQRYSDDGYLGEFATSISRTSSAPHQDVRQQSTMPIRPNQKTHLQRRGSGSINYPGLIASSASFATSMSKTMSRDEIVENLNFGGGLDRCEHSRSPVAPS
jgi:hypothetical protein